MLVACLTTAFIIDDDDLSNAERAAITAKKLSMRLSDAEYVRARNNAIAITHMDLNSESIPELLSSYFGNETTG